MAEKWGVLPTPKTVGQLNVPKGDTNGVPEWNSVTIWTTSASTYREFFRAVTFGLHDQGCWSTVAGEYLACCQTGKGCASGNRKPVPTTGIQIAGSI